jgi:hypothetical protein
MSVVDAIPEPPSDWNDHLVEQLADHWTRHLRPGLQGLTDEEYFWEPTPGAWSLRPRGTERTELALGSGEMVMEGAYPEPHDPPLTTIAWRLAHIAVWVLGIRNANHFAGPETGSLFSTAEYAPTASTALAQLDEAIERWFDGVRSLGVDRLSEPVGEAEGPYAAHPYAALVLHVNREVIHHGAEILLLRQLYGQRSDRHDGG